MTPAADPKMEPVPVTRLELALWALAALSCSQVGYVGDPKHGPFIAAADVLCVALVAAWGAMVVWRRRWGTIALPPRAVVAWGAVGLLSLSKCALDAEGGVALGALKDGVVEIAQLLLYFGLAYCMLTDVLSGAVQVRRLAVLFLVATSAVVAWGLVDYLTEDDPVRVYAGFGNRNVYSAFLVVMLPLLFGQAIHERRTAWRWWAFAVCAVGALTMLAPPHLWLLAGIMIWQVYARGGRHRVALVASIVGLCAALMLLPRNYECNVAELRDPLERGELYKLEIPADGAVAGGGEPQESVALVRKRWLEWQPAVAMLAENVPLGVGAGSFQRNIGDAAYYGSLPNAKKSEPDTANLYLVTGASMGLSGLICLVALLQHFAAKASRLWLSAEDSSERGMAAGLQGALVGIILANLFTSLFVRGVALTWSAVMAMTTATSRSRALHQGGRSPAQREAPGRQGNTSRNLR